ncbi:MAG: Formate dehydrogenase subunit alpha [Methanoregulaceae archaeon PtaB.Bin009]|jgi:formylmethanofuran dehydrogenase subunit B|nr:MAG: Formate dehydrogenase subunit alpha [Methanoregulaceae archaeon PtaB.Bin009]OPY42807.1 MAG: Formate dehydrogenase subunit alpha [Methanoregulaceae archaeon PtaU1.Bin066]
MRMLMNSGRTYKQGEQLYYKESPEYSEQTSLCFINPIDLFTLGIEEGENIEIKTSTGNTVFRTVACYDLVPGEIFLPCGPYANFILPPNTHSTGAPDFKTLEVEVRPTERERVSAWDLLEYEGGTRYDAPPEGCPTISLEGDKTVTDVLCPLCGCVCDDIELGIRDHRIVSCQNGCLLCNAKFLAKNRLITPIKKTVGGWEKVSYEEAIEYIADVLVAAERPLLFGWSGTHGEAQCIGVSIAELIGGVIDNCSSECHGPSIMAIQEVGHPGCTLGQVRNRADVVIYWGSNPIASHPRHMSRYSTYADGFFLDNSFRNRTVIVFDVRKTETAKVADEFVRVRSGGDYAVFSALRAIIQGKEDVLPKSVAGVAKEELIRISRIMLGAKFGTFFTGIGLTQSRGKYKNVRNAIELVDELNRHTKYTLTPMRGHWNVYGTNQTFTYMTGYPYAVDFSHGVAYYNPGETSAIDMLSREEVDACIIIGSDPGAHFPRACNEHLSRIPTIVIDPFPIMSTAVATMHIPVAMTGVDAEGTAYRMDAVPLWVQKVMEPTQPDDARLLSRIYDAVRKRKGMPQIKGEDAGVFGSPVFSTEK